MSPRQIVVLGGGEPWASDLVRVIPNAGEVSFPPGSPPEAWAAALARIEVADVVVVALSAATISDPAWSSVAITLSPRARGLRFTTDQGSGSATPADLSPAGDAFAVTYQAGQDAAPAAPPAT